MQFLSLRRSGESIVSLTQMPIQQQQRRFAESTLSGEMPGSLAAMKMRAVGAALVADQGAHVGHPYKALRFALLALLLAAPLAFGAVEAWAWGAMAVAAFLLLLLWVIAGARRGVLRILWSPLYLPGAFFFLVGMVQFAAGLTMDATGTREALLKLSTDLILFFLAVQLFRGDFMSLSLATGHANGRVVPRLDKEGLGVVDAWPTTPGLSSTRRGATLRAAPESLRVGADLDILRWTLLIYTIVLALFAIFQFFSSDGLIYWRVKTAGWTFGPYVNHNHYAGLMEMLIPLSFAAALPALRKHPAAAMMACALLIPVVSLLLSGSRGGFISLLVEVLLAAVLIFRCGPLEARRLTALPGGCALAAAALLFMWMAPRHATERLTRLGNGAYPPDVELGYRLEAARDTLAIWRDHLWLGTGLGTFESAFPRYQTFATDLRWDHVHNDYLEALAETGLAGAAAMAGALLIFLRLAFRNLRQRFRQSHGWMQFAAALGCCGILVHSLADFNLHMPANAAWFAVCAAWATSSDE